MAERTTSARLDARYGRTRGRRIRARVWAVIAGAGVLAVSLAWVVWVGLASPDANLESRDLGYTLTSDTATATWELNSPPHTTAKCAVEALDDGKSIVGWKVVSIPASGERVRRFTETVRTSEPPVTGLIYRCWLT
jgi:hypothetical protein